VDIDFIKMHGAGNDYIYLDLLDRSLDLDFAGLARAMSPRHFAVGADGLVLILRNGPAEEDTPAGASGGTPARAVAAGEPAPFRMRMFNADGSEAEMCGNAIRCVGKYLFDRGQAGERMRILTGAGVKNVRVVERGPGGARLLQVDMGRPFLAGRDIPVSVDAEPVTDLEAGGYRGAAVGMGNPHFVIFTDRVTDRMVLEDGPLLEKDPVFPKKTNVEFVQVLDPGRVRMRVWERGSGETLACGTGACAAAVASALTGRTGREVDVELPGGTLRIRWEPEGTVLMTGPAVEVFRGRFTYAP
jgi:diaminopimelate epimerase